MAPTHTRDPGQPRMVTVGEHTHSLSEWARIWGTTPQRIWQVITLAEGRCQSCGQPRGEDGSRTECRACRDRHAAASKTHDARAKRRTRRRAKGRTDRVALTVAAHGWNMAAAARELGISRQRVAEVMASPPPAPRVRKERPPRLPRLPKPPKPPKLREERPTPPRVTPEVALAAVVASGWNVSAAARRLGVGRSWLTAIIANEERPPKPPPKPLVRPFWRAAHRWLTGSWFRARAEAAEAELARQYASNRRGRAPTLEQVAEFQALLLRHDLNMAAAGRELGVTQPAISNRLRGWSLVGWYREELAKAGRKHNLKYKHRTTKGP